MRIPYAKKILMHDRKIHYASFMNIEIAGYIIFQEYSYPLNSQTSLTYIRMVYGTIYVQTAEKYLA